VFLFLGLAFLFVFLLPLFSSSFHRHFLPISLYA
jgi:hypothetical protein